MFKLEQNRSQCCMNTRSFTYPQRKKSQVFKSGDIRRKLRRIKSGAHCDQSNGMVVPCLKNYISSNVSEFMLHVIEK